MTDVALLPALEHVISIHVPMKGTTVEAAVGLALNEFQSSCPVRGTTAVDRDYKSQDCTSLQKMDTGKELMSGKGIITGRAKQARRTF